MYTAHYVFVSWLDIPLIVTLNPIAQKVNCSVIGFNGKSF